MKFPILFASNATDFFSLGLGPMTNTLEATVTEERNGSFYFDSKVIIDDQCYPLLEENRIIRADASPELLDQRFRIKKITDNHDGTAQVYAEHVSYITQELSLKPQITVSGTGSTAINVWKNAIIDSNPLTVDSNIPTSTTTSWRIDEVENARQALGGVKGSLLDMWGGEYRFDNYHISLLQKRGTTANVLLAYGRNITDFEQERNITDTYNSLYPYAIYTDDNQKEHLVTLPTFFVDTDNIANFPNRKALPIDFSDQFKQDEVPTAVKLKSLAQSYIKSNDIGIPKVSIKVSFIDLAKTTDYADIAPLEKLNLCDEVRVIYPKLNVNTTAKVVRVVWNVLAETYDQIEIGEKRASLSDKLNEQSQSIKEANTQANTAISASNNKNTVFYGLYGTDGLGEPIANKIGDLWFKPDGEETVMLQWDGTLWRRIINTGKLTELDQAFEESNKKIEQAEEDLADVKNRLDQTEKDLAADKELIASNKKELDQAKQVLDTTITELDQAKKDIENDKAYIDSVKAQADEIAKQADDASTVANLSKIIADEAKNASDTANKNADAANKLSSEAKTSADQAKKNAEQALSDASSAVANANQAKSNASTALTNANQALTNAANVDQKVKTEVSRIDGELSSKASQTTVDTLNKTVSNHTTQITQNQNDIKIKANQSTVDTLNQTVSNQGTSIEANAKAISLKAAQTDVNAISGRVSSAESSIKVNADSIKNLVTKTDGTNTKVASLEQNVNGFKQTVAETYVETKDIEKLNKETMIKNGDFAADFLFWEKNGDCRIGLSTVHNQHCAIYGNGYVRYTGKVNLYKDRVYRIKFIAYVAANWEGEYANTKLRLGDKNGNLLYNIEISKTVGQWNDYEAIYRPENDFVSAEITLRNGATNNGMVGYTNVELEDITESLNTTTKISTLEQNIEGFKTNVAQIYETKTSASAKFTTLEQNIEGFKTTAAQTYSTKNELNTTNSKVSQIEQTNSNIKTAIADITTIGNSDNMIQDVSFTNTFWEKTANVELVSSAYAGNSGIRINRDGRAEYIPDIFFKNGRNYEISVYYYIATATSGFADNFKLRIGNKTTGAAITGFNFNNSVKGDWQEAKIQFTGNLTDAKISFLLVSDATAGYIMFSLPSVKDVTDFKNLSTKITTLEQNVEGFKTTVSNTYAAKNETMSFKGTITGNQSVDNLETGWYYISGWTAGPQTKIWGKLQNFNNGTREQLLVLGNGVTYSRGYQGNPSVWSAWKQAADNSELQTNIAKVSTLEQNVEGFKATVSEVYSTKTEVSSKISKVEQSVSDYKVLVGQTYSTKSELDQKANAVQYVTGSSNADGKKSWVRFLRTIVDKQYAESQLSIDFLGSGSGDGITRSARLDIRHKHQTPLATTDPAVDLTVSNAVNMYKTDFKAVLTSNTSSGSYIDYFVWLDTDYLYYTLTPYNMNDEKRIIRTYDSFQFNLPSGKTFEAVYGGAYLKAAQLEVTVNEISGKIVEKGKVVSAINLNESGIRLLGKFIKLDGTSYIEDGVIYNAHIANATILNTNIRDATIQGAKIANATIDGANIKNATIQSANIADLAVQNAHIANGTIQGVKIADAAITNANIRDSTIQGAKIADATIVNANIKDATIESAKIKSISAEKITAGTLNAANVNIINLNANNITSGNINGINITGSTVTSQKGSSRIVLDGGALSWYVSNGLVGSIYTNEDSGITQASWDVYDAGYFSIRGKGSYDGELYMRYGWGALKSIVSGIVSIVSKNKYGDRSTTIESNNSQVILTAGSGSGSSYRYGQIQVGAYGTSVTGGMTISGGLSVTGSKNAIHQVDGQWYATPAYETAESYLGDIGSTTTNNDSMVLISIDNLFGRIVNTSLEYQVFVSSYGSGHVWVEKRMQNAFIVRSSEPNTKFAWEIKAKRKGYEQERLVKHSLIA